jgi:predicted secreted protein
VTSLALLLSACSFGEAPDRSATLGVPLGVYAGILPCADCAGIRMELRLYADPGSGRPTRYERQQTLLGTRDGDITTEKVGRWTIERTADDPRVVLYQLDYDQPKTRQSFLKVGNDELRLLDRHEEEIPLSAPHSLYRVAQPAPRANVTLTESEAGRTIEVAVGQRIVVRLAAARAGGNEWLLDSAASNVLTLLADASFFPDFSRASGATIESWSFRVTAAGEAELRFEYRRPFDKAAAPVKVVRFLVRAS